MGNRTYEYNTKATHAVGAFDQVVVEGVRFVSPAVNCRRIREELQNAVFAVDRIANGGLHAFFDRAAVVGRKIDAARSGGVLIDTDETDARGGAHRNVNLDSGPLELLREHGERSSAEASGDEQHTLCVVRDTPAAPERAEHGDGFATFQTGEFTRPLADHLVQEGDGFPFSAIDRERSAQDPRAVG